LLGRQIVTNLDMNAKLYHEKLDSVCSYLGQREVGAHVEDIAPGLGSPLPHLRRDKSGSHRLASTLGPGSSPPSSRRN
jgi:hypothetical protein